VLGELVASQLHGALADRLDSRDDPAGALLAGDSVGDFFRELFALGARHQWEDTLQRITGSRLTPGPYLQRFVGEP